MTSAPSIIISRFILNLRRANERYRTVESHFSRFTMPEFQIQTAGRFIGEMGFPLDHSSQEPEDEIQEQNRDVGDSNPASSYEGAGMVC